MLTSLKNNKIPKRERKLGHKEYVEGVPIGKPLKYKNKLSKAQMDVFKEELEKQKKRRTKITIISYIIGMTIAISIVYHYLY